MPSLPQIALVVIVALVAWKLHRYFRGGRIRDKNVERAEAMPRGVTDTAECAVCGSFLPVNSTVGCDRTDCPRT